MDGQRQTGHPCLFQNCSQRPPAEMTGKGSLLNHPSCLPPPPTPDDPIGQGAERNGTVANCFLDGKSLVRVQLSPEPSADGTGCSIPQTRAPRIDYSPGLYSFATIIIFLTTVLSHWDFSHGKFGSNSQEKARCDRVALPKLRCTLGVLVFQ